MMDEMRFYFNNSQYSAFRRNLAYNVRRRGLDPDAASEIAKEKAWEEVLRSKGREWLLALPTLPPTLRRLLEGDGGEDDRPRLPRRRETGVGTMQPGLGGRGRSSSGAQWRF